MHVAVLSAGTSLAKTWPSGCNRTYYATVIAVNRALKVYDADWLAAGDLITFEEIGDRRPRFGYWSMKDQVRIHPKGWQATRGISFESFPGWTDLVRPGQWSVQAAIAGAHMLGATIVDIYGHDMSGLLDVSGSPGDGRNDSRWQREALDWQATLTWAQAQGMTINHIKDSNGKEH